MGAQQTPESIARWAEQQGEERKPVGAAGHLSPEQKQTIRVAYLETGGCVTYAELGKRCQVLIGRAVNRETVAACMKGPEYDKLRKHFDTEIKASAVERLKAGILPAADAWVRSVGVAADKGDHKPAKDLLMHTGTIEPLDDDGRAKGPLVLIAVKQGDRHYYQQPGATVGSAPVFPEPLWTDGERTYTREEKTELARTNKGRMIVQVGGDPSRVKLLPPPAEPLWSDGTRTYTREERDAIKGDFVQIGVDESDVTMSLSADAEAPIYRARATGEVLTESEAVERSQKQDVITIGVQLPGLGE